MPSRLAIIETSHWQGWIALGDGETVLGQTRLDEARRHTRDLVPALDALLKEQAWKPADLDAVIVSVGPGSYTGLRVGLMSAKTLAYATGARLIGIDTFAAVALQAQVQLQPLGVEAVDVIADAQQDRIYLQRFEFSAELVRAVAPLRIDTFADWCEQHDGWVAGPGLEVYGSRLDNKLRVAAEHWLPRPASLQQLGKVRLERGEHDDPFALEPLYLRPSAAEQQWHARKMQTGPQTGP